MCVYHLLTASKAISVDGGKTHTCRPRRGFMRVMFSVSDQTDLIGSQRDTPTAAGAEATLTVAAGSAAAVGELGFVANAASGRLRPRRLSCGRLLPQLLHLVFVHFKLLM